MYLFYQDKFKSYQLFLLILTLSLIVVILQKSIIDKEFYYQMFSNQLTIDKIDTLLENQSKYAWVGYILLPFVLLIKQSIIAFFILMILVLSNCDINFSKTFKIALISSSASLLLTMAQLLRIYQTPFDKINSEIVSQTPLSIALLFNKNDIILPLYQFLQLINPFELFYIYLIYVGIRKTLNVTKIKSINLSLTIWAIFTIFTIIVSSFLMLSLQ
jgi:hypothetical protein